MNKQKLMIGVAIAGVGILSAILIHNMKKDKKHVSHLNDYYDCIDEHGVRRCKHEANKILNKFDYYE